MKGNHSKKLSKSKNARSTSRSKTSSSSQIPIKKTATYLQIYNFINQQISILTSEPTSEAQNQIVADVAEQFPDISETKILAETKKLITLYQKEISAHKRQYFTKSAIDQVSQQVFYAFRSKQADEIKKLSVISQFSIPIVSAFNGNRATPAFKNSSKEIITKFELSDILEIVRQLPEEKYLNFKQLKDFNLNESNNDDNYDDDDDVVEIESLESKELKKLLRRYLLLRITTSIQRFKIINKLQQLHKYKQIREALQQNIIGCPSRNSFIDIEDDVSDKDQIQRNLITSRGVVLDEIAKLRINLGMVIPKLQVLNNEENKHNNEKKKYEISKVLQEIQQKDLKKRLDKFI